MANCKDLHEIGTQAYKDCLKENKSEEEEEVVEVDEEVIVEKSSSTAADYEKDLTVGNTNAMSELQKYINRNRTAAGLEPQDNTDIEYDPNKDQNQLTETTISKDETDVSKFELERRAEREAEKKAIAEGTKKLTFKESVKNSAANFLLQLKGVDDRARWLWAYAGRLDAEMGYGGEGAAEKWTKIPTLGGLGRVLIIPLLIITQVIP